MKKHSFWFRRCLAAILCLVLTAALAGCGGDSGSKSLRVDLSGSIRTLDPQLSGTSLSQCILPNCMEGLLRRLPDGTLTEGVAQDYQITSGGLTYTFTLREDAAWSDGTPITADDFVFALQRVFRGDAGAAAAQELSAIRRGWRAYQGLTDSEGIGVSAPDSRTLVLSLTESDPLMLEHLTEPYAYPCNREYYESTHSRYGNSLDYMLFNGPFVISDWSSDTIKLTANAHYSGISTAQCPSVTCYLNRSRALDSFLSGETDFYTLDYATIAKLPTETTKLITFQNGMVDLIFNRAEDKLTASLELRRALCLSVEMPDFVENGRLPEHYEYTMSLAPAAAMVYDESYYELLRRGFQLGEVTYTSGGEPETVQDFRHSNQLGFTYSLSSAKAALLDSELTEVEGLSILIPQESDLIEFAGWLQRQWYDHLRIIVNLEAVPAEEYEARLQSGDYTIAIASYTAGSDPDTVFRAFLTGMAPVQFTSDRLQELLSMAKSAPNVSEAVRYYANAEALLLGEVVAMPLFSSSSYFAMGDGVDGILVSSDGRSIFFAGATRK